MIEPTLEFIGNGLRAGSNPASFYFSYGNVLFIFDYHPAHNRFFCTRKMIQMIQRSCTIVFVQTMRSRYHPERDEDADITKVDMIERVVGLNMPMPKIVFLFPSEGQNDFCIRTIEYISTPSGGLNIDIHEDTLVDPATIMTNKEQVLILIRSNPIARIYDYYEENNFGEVIVWIKTSHTNPFFVYNGLQALFPDSASFNNPFVKNIVYLDNFMLQMTVDRDAYLKNLANTISLLKGPVYLMGNVPNVYKVNIVKYDTKRM